MFLLLLDSRSYRTFSSVDMLKEVHDIYREHLVRFFPVTSYYYFYLISSTDCFFEKRSVVSFTKVVLTAVYR